MIKAKENETMIKTYYSETLKRRVTVPENNKGFERDACAMHGYSVIIKLALT
jgi:hypothetical protein